MALRRDSYTVLRETLRWRVALVLGVTVSLLMVVLGVINTQLGFRDTALLAWGVLAVSGSSTLALLAMPRQLGGTLFFLAIVGLLVVVPAFGLAYDRPMVHWAYIMPPVLVFLMRPGLSLAGMLAYGTYVTVMTVPLLAPIDVIRFSSGYGLLVCFMYTYALLQERAAAMLRFHSDHDALSNCLNRRTFNEALEQLERGSGERTCTFLLVDIDHFKAINDQHGHLVGDRIITQVAAALGKQLDPGTPLFRYGGEEFASVLDGVGLDAGAALAERLRAAIADSDFQGVPVTVSIGVAEWRRGRGSTAHAVGEADGALYDAKRAGRNRVATRRPLPNPAGPAEAPIAAPERTPA